MLLNSHIDKLTSQGTDVVSILIFIKFYSIVSSEVIPNSHAIYIPNVLTVRKLNCSTADPL